MGPSVAVLVPPEIATLGPVVRRAVDEVGLRIERNGGAEDLPLIELRDSSDRPYALAATPWPSAEEEKREHDKVSDAVGFRPRFEVVLLAYVNRTPCHRTLGRLALDLAERTEGWVDLAGALSPPGRTSANCSLAEVYSYAAALRLPGRLRAIEYEAARSTRWLYHVMDVEAMRAWLNHPDFHLIK